MKTLLSIIIVNWNVRDYLRDCLHSLMKHATDTSFEIIVVDNASTDDSVNMVRREFPHVRVIALTSNTGFAAANNRGVEIAQGKYLLFLNPDTEVVQGSLLQLINYFEHNPGVGIVAPCIKNSDGSFQEGSIRRTPTVGSQILVLSKLSRYLKNMKALQRYYAHDFNPNTTQEVEQVMGAALMISCQYFLELGKFDERFFLWFEEVDLCTRVRKGGRSIMFLASAHVIHHGGRSFMQSLPLVKQRIFNKSVLLYFKKHNSSFAVMALSVMVPFNVLVTFLQQIVTRHAKQTHNI